MNTFCPQCGFGVLVDEDGCCTMCGATAVGAGVDEICILVTKVFDLERGCSCDYDYRCHNCQTIIDVYTMARKILNDVSRTRKS